MNTGETIKLLLPLAPVHHEEAIAVLAEMGFYAFEELPTQLAAYIAPADFESMTSTAWSEVIPALDGTPQVEQIPATDWNAEWESNFTPIRLSDFCLIRAPFHPADPGVEIDLMIVPKMSFGTGHHETTRLMALQCQRLPLSGARVLDVGTGTGVLAILASKLGAREVVGVDIDSWSYDNALENAEMNGVDNFQVLLGTVENVPSPCYDILLANINRNVIVADRDAYLRLLCKGGQLALSGFLREDEEQVRQHYEGAGFIYLRSLQEGNWVSLAFQAP
jgi:ribosomal protein L11 methyltransferase